MATMIGKKDMVDLVAERGKLTKKSAETAINAFIDAVTESLSRDQMIRIIPFGSFEVRARSARTGRNPRTGSEIKIKARKVPVFKPGKGLKDMVK